MLLPTRGVTVDKALLSVGATILTSLESPASVTALWEKVQAPYAQSVPGHRVTAITFDWFSLALASLYALGLVDNSRDGLIRRMYVS